MNKLLKPYVFTSVAYGMLRKIPMLHDAHVETWERTEDYKYKTRPLLLTEKSIVLLSSAVISPYVAPYWLYSDLGEMEVRARKEDKSLYGYHKPTYMAMYVLM